MWDDIISHLEAVTFDGNGLLMRDGVARGDTRSMLNRAITELATWAGRTVTVKKIGEFMSADRTVVNDIAARHNADLIAPLIAMEARQAPAEYLTTTVIRGRTGSEMRQGVPTPAQPVGVHTQPDWAPHECLAGWAFVPGGEHISDIAVELLSPVLKGTIDDHPGFVEEPGRTVEPSKMLLAQLGRRDLAVRSIRMHYPRPDTEVADRHLEEIRYDESKAATAWRRADRQSRMPVVADAVPYGFVKRRGGGTYPAAGHWYPGLDRGFVSRLGTRGPWAAYAFDFGPASRDIAWLERIGSRDTDHWGQAFFDALILGELPAVEVGRDVWRVSGVVLQAHEVDLLIHDSLLRIGTAWTIATETAPADAQLLARCLGRHLLGEQDQSRPTEWLAGQIDQRYGLLRVQATDPPVRRFVRALALAGNARQLSSQ